MIVRNIRRPSWDRWPRRLRSTAPMGSSSTSSSTRCRVRGEPWSQWGQGVVLDDGRFISAVGDHRGRDGNAYVYE